MVWEKVELHVENLVPGVVLGGFLYSFEPVASLVGGVSEVAAAVVFLGVSYLLGTLGNVFARLLLAGPSQITLRPLLLNIFCRRKLEGWRWKGIGKWYSDALDAGLNCGVPEVVAELLKRRQTGRLVRSSLGPLLVGIWLLQQPTPSVAHLLAAYLGILILYAYSEVALFNEAARGRRMLRADVAATDLDRIDDGS